MDGVVLIDKPEGITSRTAVVRARRALGVEKAGHAGTLDPLATGLLVVCLGRGTLLSSELAKGDKTYEVGALFGTTTDTYDIEGKVLDRSEKGLPGHDDIKRIMSVFLGEIEQVPPPFSAVKVRGKPLYRYARNGEQVAPAHRRVRVDSIKLLGVEEPAGGGVVARFRITCGPGTYVRSIVHDMGKTLGCGACVCELRRLSSGGFTVESATTLEELESFGRDASVESLLSLEEATAWMPGVELDGNAARAARLGQPLTSELLPGLELPSVDVFRVLDGGGTLIALYGGPRASDPPEIAARARRVIRPASNGSEAASVEVTG